MKELDIADGSFDKVTGSILWTRKITSGSTVKIAFSYEIKYPKDIKLRYHN